MNTLKLIAFVTTILLITSACEEPVKFTEPQPADKSDLSHFPGYMIGRYKSADDDGYIEIDNKAIVYKQINIVTISKAEADTSSELKLAGDSMIDIENKISFKVNLINDTLHGTINLSDTIFNIDDNNVLRKYRGHYFINSKNEDGSYSVQMITYQKGGQLEIAGIQKEEIENLKAVTEIVEPNDSTFNSNFQFKPTKKEFKQFINDMHGFRNTTSFTKIK